MNTYPQPFSRRRENDANSKKTIARAMIFRLHLIPPPRLPGAGFSPVLGERLLPGLAVRLDFQRQLRGLVGDDGDVPVAVLGLGLGQEGRDARLDVLVALPVSPVILGRSEAETRGSILRLVFQLDGLRDAQRRQLDVSPAGGEVAFVVRRGAVGLVDDVDCRII